MAERMRVVPVELPDGARVMVQASMSCGEDEDVSALDKALELNNVTASIESIAKALTVTIEKVKPDKACIEFGIALTLEAGSLSALLVQGSAASNLKISLTWGK